MTPAQVKIRLREAAKTFWAWDANQPEVGPKAFGSNWPAIIREAAEAYGWTPELHRPAPPYPHEISRMEEAFRWLDILPKQDRWLLWAWANEMAMWKITQRTGKSRRTVFNWVDRACGVIAGSIKNQAA